MGIRYIGRWWLAALLLGGAATGCDDGGGGTPDGGDTADDAGPDEAGGEATDDGGGDADPGPWAGVVVTVEADGDETPVDLSTLSRTTFEGQDAVRLTRVVEAAALARPWNYHYGFVGNDGFDPLVERLDGDLGKLPVYGELESGFLYWDEGTLRIGWDPALGFPGSLGVRGMDGGIVRLTPIAPTTVVISVGEGRTLVDLTTQPTEEVVDYEIPDDGPRPSIPLPALLAAGGATTPEAFVYKMWGNDGWSNADDNLMPWENAQHAWLRVDTRRVVIAEEWNTDECCWRTRDTVFIEGRTP